MQEQRYVCFFAQPYLQHVESLQQVHNIGGQGLEAGVGKSFPQCGHMPDSYCSHHTLQFCAEHLQTRPKQSTHAACEEGLAKHVQWQEINVFSSHFSCSLVAVSGGKAGKARERTHSLMSNQA